MTTTKEQIEQLENQIKELKKLQEEETVKTWPNVVGKYYQPFGNCAIKIKAIRNYDEKFKEFSIDCESVSISNNYSMSVDLDNFYDDIRLDSEISKEEYYKWYDKAIEFINKLR